MRINADVDYIEFMGSRSNSPLLSGLRRLARNNNLDASGATKQPDGRITSDFQKYCQAQESKIFLFSLIPTRFTS
jgi:hypothetical protein